MNQRNRTNKAYNLDLLDCVDFTSDDFQLPIIKCDDCVPTSLVSFNRMLTSKSYDSYIHFYVDDYQFERIWKEPDRYLNSIKKFQGIIAPDFSTYLDMPMPQQIYNVYRSRLLGAYYQSKGIKVIPCAQWSDARSYLYSFSGIEEGSTIAVSSVGAYRNKEARSYFIGGLMELIKQTKPRRIVFYGVIPQFDFGGIEVIHFDNEDSKWGN